LTSSSTSSTERPLLEIGRIARPHGLRGQVVVELWSNRPERMARGAVWHAPHGRLEVAQSSRLPSAGGHERWLVSLQGVEDRAGAEELRGAVLRAEPIDDAGALWVHELVSSSVLDAEGNRLGVVQAVEANPASDLLVLDTGPLIPLRFVAARGEGWVRVELPAGLLDL
jgi:16S rRNA processing protein RimM